VKGNFTTELKKQAVVYQAASTIAAAVRLFSYDVSYTTTDNG